MNFLLSWIKRNKLAGFLILVIIIFFGKSLMESFFGFTVSTPLSYESDQSYSLGAPEAGISSSKRIGIIPPLPDQAPPQTNVPDRLVVQESNLSLVVKNVRQSVDQIISKATEAGGYMVSSNLNQPEEAPFANVVVRIPADKLDQVLEYYRSLAIKVSSEYLQGYDVTDQYLDIETRLNRLRRTQAKFEQLLDQATNFDQILQAQREILSLQDQIDNYTGQQHYLEQTAKLAKLTLYLSTDELALPYSPSDTFRPLVTFKLAVRSLVLTVRSVIKLIIWMAVYGIIWIPAILLFIFVRRWWLKRQNK